MTMRRAAAALLCAAAALLGGCAMLQPAPAPAAAESAPPAERAVQLRIEAPAPLQALLERHLDLVRLGSLDRGDVDDSEWSRLIDATPAQVRELLQTEGYFAPKVTLERGGRGTGSAPEDVRLLVEPGVQARVGRLTLEVQGELQEAAEAGDPYAAGVLTQLRQRWALAEGAPFRNAAWSDAKAAALAALRAAGYAAAAWAGTGAEIDPQTQQVRLFLVADSGPLFRLGELQVEGLVVQDVATVRNLVLARGGSPVSESFLLDFQDRLQKTYLFDSVVVTLDTDPAHAAAASVSVKLREAPLQVWTFGAGVSANNGPRASVEHLYRRVFGHAASAHNKVEIGTKRRAWEGDITQHAGEGLYRKLVGGAVEWQESDTDEVLSQRLRVGVTQDTPRIERLVFAEAERSVRTPIGGLRTTALALSGNLHLTWRDLDSVVLPTQGLTLAAQLGLGRSRGTNAPAGNFQRTYARLTGYLPLGRTWYGQARIEAGKVFLPGGVLVPDSRLFRAGGDDSVRGYAYRSLGPLVGGVVGGGKALLTGSVELARPISAALPSVWGAAFVDAGNAADGFGRLKPAVGYGVGVRWRSPVGPLRIDFAHAVETGKNRLHFSVGIAF